MMANDSTQTSTSIEVPPHARPFPPFDRQTFPSQLLWLTLTFVALYLLMARLALPRIGAIVADRRKRISDEFDAARRLKGESEASSAAYERTLIEARQKAGAVVNDSRQLGAAQAESRRKALDATLSARIAGAEKRIADDKSSALSAVRGITDEVAAAIVERLTGSTAGGPDAAVAKVTKR
jgi:F-type H+-transporting ATPase subunit b